MRTTLSLDDDIATLLREEMLRSGESLDGAVNRCLRAGLMPAGRQTAKPFVVTPIKLGLPAGASYDRIADLLEVLEEPEPAGRS